MTTDPSSAHDKTCHSSVGRAGRRCHSTEDLLIGLFIEADHQRAAFPQRGGTQIARRTKQQLLERGRVGSVFFHIQVNDFLSLGRVDFIHLAGQLQRFGFSPRLLFRVDFLGSFNGGIRKKLLRFPTRLSARAVIAPVDFGHVFPLSISVGR